MRFSRLGQFLLFSIGVLILFALHLVFDGSKTELRSDGPSKVVSVTADTYDQTVADSLKAGKPVLIDYYAEWCGPCKQLAPTVDALSVKYGDRVTFVRIDASVYTQIGDKEGVPGYPTQKIKWATGEDERVGLQSYDDEEDFILKAITAAKSSAR